MSGNSKKSTALIVAISIFLALLTGGWTVAHFYKKKVAVETTNEFIRSFFPYSTASYRIDIGLNPLSRKVVLTEVIIRTPMVPDGEMNIRKVIINDFEVSERYSIPLKADIRIEGIAVNIEQALQGLPDADRKHMAGMIPKEINAGFVFRFDPDRRELHLTDSFVDMVDVAEVGLEYHVYSVPTTLYSRLEENPFAKLLFADNPQTRMIIGLQVLEMIKDLRIESISLRFKNHSLVQSIIASIAAEEGKSPEELLTTAEREIEKARQTTPHPFLQDLVVAFRDFLRSPNTISVRIRATSRPFRIGNILNVKSVSDFKKMARLTVTVNGKDYSL